MEAFKIIEENCKPYGGFINVITNCGGTLVSQVWIKSMEDYSNLRLGAVSGECEHPYCAVTRDKITELCTCSKCGKEWY